MPVTPATIAVTHWSRTVFQVLSWTFNISSHISLSLKRSQSLCHFSPILQMRPSGNKDVKLFIQHLTAGKRQNLDWNSELPTPALLPHGCGSSPTPGATLLRFLSPALACPPSTQDDDLGIQVATTWGH